MKRSGFILVLVLLIGFGTSDCFILFKEERDD